jgi:hypothetical protein
MQDNRSSSSSNQAPSDCCVLLAGLTAGIAGLLSISVSKHDKASSMVAFALLFRLRAEH